MVIRSLIPLICIPACVAVDEPESDSSGMHWSAWFSEYEAANAPAPGEELFTVTPRRVIISGVDVPIKTRLQFDTSARSLTVRRRGGAYWFSEVPLFMPSSEVLEVKTVDHVCSASRIDDGYDIVCRHLTSKGSVLRSKIKDGFGIKWFEYYCGTDYNVICKYSYAKGSAIFGPVMLDGLG